MAVTTTSEVSAGHLRTAPAIQLCLPTAWRVADQSGRQTLLSESGLQGRQAFSRYGPGCCQEAGFSSGCQGDHISAVASSRVQLRCFCCGDVCWEPSCAPCSFHRAPREIGCLSSSSASSSCRSLIVRAPLIHHISGAQGFRICHS